MEELEISQRLRSMICLTLDVNVKRGLWDVSFYVGDEAQMRLLEIGNYFDLRNGEISFCPRGRVQKTTDSGKWVRKGRVMMKAGKFFSLLDYQIDERAEARDNDGERLTLHDAVVLNKAYEIVSAKVKSSGMKVNIRVSGEISKVYGMGYDEEESGRLSRSCMRWDSDHACKDHADFYDQLPGLKIMYVKNASGYLIARALLWRCEEGMFLDRVYANENVQETFYELARNRGWIYREFGNEPYRDLTYKANVNLYTKALNVGTPYVDTLPYLIQDFTLSNKCNTRESFSLQSTDGWAIYPPEMCRCCGKTLVYSYEQKDIRNYGVVCDRCINNGAFVRCTRCGVWMQINDAKRFVRSHGEVVYYCQDHYDTYISKCQHCGKLIEIDMDAIRAMDVGYTTFYWCSAECMGEDVVRCKVTNRNVFKSNARFFEGFGWVRLSHVEDPRLIQFLHILHNSNVMVEEGGCDVSEQ